MIRVLLSSADLKLQSLLAAALGREFEILLETDTDRCKQLVSDRSVDVFLLDLETRDRSLEELVKVYDEIAPLGIAGIAITDDAARQAVIELMSRGLLGYCRKPLAIREMKPMLRRAFEHTALKREVEKKRVLEHERESQQSSCDGLIGTSRHMQGVYDLIRRVAHLNASVLITGETGTGKELIARAIHTLGGREKLPFVAVSCGAIPETLIESELFGHEKGAFTGSAGMRLGYLEQAGSGTLLLDEIGELSLMTQVKLLRVLQQREFTRLGSSRPIPLKARVLLATHRDLEQMVQKGAFRLDLYYRMNVITVKAPSLADRPEDIPLLAQHFVKQYADLYNPNVMGITPEALDLMHQYEWPGNVRELENVIQSATVRADGEYIIPKDLPERLQEMDVPVPIDSPLVGSFERLLRDYKVKLAMKAIEECDGNKTLAARSLNISRAYLHRLIRLTEGVEDFTAA